MNSTQVGLVLNPDNESITSNYHVVFDYMFSTVGSITSDDPEVCISMITSRKFSIHVMLYKEDDTELDVEWLTTDESLTHLRKYIERFVVRVKGSETPYI